MNKSTFLKVLKKSFICYLENGSRSNKKLKILHKAIAEDVLERINRSDNHDSYSIASLGIGSEEKINGRYLEKAVDIVIKRNNVPIAGIAVKYVMSNYMQNSNNYFENMLGETANIRCKDIQYFQVFIVSDKIPYFDKKDKIKKWETIGKHNLDKYIILSNDNIDKYFHTPNKTLVYVINISGDISNIETKKKYSDYYLANQFTIELSNKNFEFGNLIIYNDYEQFAEKMTHSILSI